MAASVSVTPRKVVRAVIPGRPGHLRRLGKRGERWVVALGGNARSHWRDKHECMAKDIEAVALHVNGQRPERPWPSAQVRVDLVVKYERDRDDDNLRGTLKGVFDGLTRAGIIADDNRAVIGSAEVTVTVDSSRAYCYALEVRPC